MPGTYRRSCAARRCIVWLQIPMGPHGNGRQRLPAALFLLLGLAAALAYFHDDVAAFSLGLGHARNIKDDLQDISKNLQKFTKKLQRDVDFFDTLRKEHATAKGSDKAKLQRRIEDWVKHCEIIEGEVRESKKGIKYMIGEAKSLGKPDIKKEAEEAEKILQTLRPQIKAAREKFQQEKSKSP